MSASLGRRYWLALTGPPPATRERDGYSLWERYRAELLGSRLPPRDPAPATANPLTEPYVAGPRIRLPRFDPAAARLAATGDPDRAEAAHTVDDWRFVLRQSGPGAVDLIAETPRPMTGLLPVDLTGPGGPRRLLMVFVPDTGGGSIGVLRLADRPEWIDVTIDAPLTGLDAAGPGLVAASVRATPDPGLDGWARVRAALPPGDPMRQVIADAAG